MNKEFLTTPEVAEQLGVSIRRVQQFINDGRLPSQQFGREHLIKEIDLAPFLTPRKAGRPRKEADIKIAPGVKKWKAEQLALPAVAPTTKRAAKRAVAPKTKTVATKKGGKK